MFCPICGSKLNTQICSSCGYDSSSDLEAFPTLDKKAAVAPRSTATRAYTASFNEKYAQLENRVKLLESGMKRMSDSLKEAEEKINALSSRTVPLRAVVEPVNKLLGAVESTEPTPPLPVFAELKRGDTFNLGRYQQADVEWTVLSVQGNTALVISKYVLDCRVFNNSGKTAGQLWAASSLREWLNGVFFRTVFSKAEQECLAPANLPEANLVHEKLFLLSVDEYDKYFDDDLPAECRPTKFAVKNGAPLDREGNTGWWLRSAGTDVNCAMGVSSKGNVVKSGYSVSRYIRGVRPAMYVKI